MAAETKDISKKSSFGQIWFILKFAGRLYWETDKRVFLLVMLLNSVTSLVIVPNLLLDKLFIDTLVSNIGNPDFSKAFSVVLTIVFARFALATFRTLANRFSGYFARKFLWKLYQKMEVIVGQKYASISVPTIEDPAFKDRYQKIERESLNRLQRVAENYIRIPQHISGILFSLSIFVFSQPLIVVVSLLSLVPTIISDRIFIRRGYELETKVSLLHRLRGIYSHFLNRTRSYMELRLLNVHNYFGKRIHEIWDEIINRRLALEKKRRTADFLAGIFDDIISYGLDGVFALQILIGKISLGTGQAYIRAISNFKDSVTSLTAAFSELYENFLYIDDLIWFLDLEEPYFNKKGQKFPDKISQGITFDNVWFRYPGTREWILKGVSFNIDPKQNIAVIGKNGAGKTTLVKLLCGFYQPDKGKITIDGVSIADLNKPSYWRQVSALFQDFENYGVSARESIAISDPEKSTDTELVRSYARMAQIDDWIISLPLKYDNPLIRDFKHGVAPSSGQSQRVGISRTLFKEGQILILDEPTSNVDPEAEEEIFNKILSLSQEKIIVFISHRFSTVRLADKILVIEKGVVSEQGSHEELLQLNSTYARLFRLQAKNYR